MKMLEEEVLLVREREYWNNIGNNPKTKGERTENTKETNWEEGQLKDWEREKEVEPCVSVCGLSFLLLLEHRLVRSLSILQSPVVYYKPTVVVRDVVAIQQYSVLVGTKSKNYVCNKKSNLQLSITLPSFTISIAVMLLYINYHSSDILQ